MHKQLKHYNNKKVSIFFENSPAKKTKRTHYSYKKPKLLWKYEINHWWL